MYMLSKNAQDLLKKHKDDINKNVFLPMFIESLVECGIELFEELRALFEKAGIDLKNADFTRLK